MAIKHLTYDAYGKTCVDRYDSTHGKENKDVNFKSRYSIYAESFYHLQNTYVF